MRHQLNCYFLKSIDKVKDEDKLVEVFYCRTHELNSMYEDLTEYIGEQEKQRAERFYFDADRRTYICCHALLRLILSLRLKAEPKSIVIVNDFRAKPFLKESTLNFNLTHTREAFAIAISNSMYVGIDIENINRQADITSLISNCLSVKESEFVTRCKQKERERFFLLWTRKEAYLKAIGTGLSARLNGFETSGRKNVFFNETILKGGNVSNTHHIFSKRLNDFYLSIAIPEKTPIVISHLDEAHIKSIMADAIKITC